MVANYFDNRRHRVGYATKMLNGFVQHKDPYWVLSCHHDDVIKWKHFPRNWPFVREIHRSPVNFPHKGQCRGALMFSLIYVWINDWVNNREAGDLRRQHGHYDVIVMCIFINNILFINNNIPSWIVTWNYLPFPKHPRCNSCNLGMDK